jgi:PTH1 family peptidyl-tRNA hydrolase
LKLIVGLGNPGSKYKTTRHNAGFLILDQILHRNNVSWQGKKFDSEFGRMRLLGEDCLLLKPQTFMNLSGKSVAQACRFFKLESEDVVVLHDDVDVPFGKVKARMGGGAGGHNGIRSTISELGSEDFARLKLGVGKPSGDKAQMDVADWVLANFSDEELNVVEKAMVDETLLRIQGIFQQSR